MQKPLSERQALALAKSYARKGEFRKAHQLYIALLNRFPQNRKAQKGLKSLQLLAQQKSGSRHLQNELNQLIGLYTQGRLEETLNEARRLSRSHPENATLHSIQGTCFAGLGDPEIAIFSYEKALKLDPDSARTHFNLGNAQRDSGKTEAAKTSYNHALAINPGYTAVHNNLGNLLLSTGDVENAHSHFKQALKAQPNNEQAHNNMGSVLKELGRYDDAISSYHKALELRPDFAEAHNNLGIVFSDLGQMDSAICCFESALEYRAGYANAYRNLSRVKTFQSGDSHITQMEQLYSSKDTNEPDSIHLCFALGKVFNDLGDTHKAFDYWSKGNALHKSQQHYKIADDEQLFSAIKQSYKSTQSIFSMPGAFSDDSIRPIFIVGMPRSGTTLVEQILASHTQVHGAGELNTVENLLTPLFRNSFKTSPDKPLVEQHHVLELRETYLEMMKSKRFEEPVMTDKMPLNFRWVGFILQALPNAKIVHVVRDPVATCWSIFQNYFPGSGLNWAYDTNDLAAYLSLYNELMKFWHSYFPDNIYQLNYESLTKYQRIETGKLLSFCELPWEEDCMNSHTVKRVVKTASSDQVRRKMYQGSSLNWKQYESHLQNLIQSLTKQGLT